MFLLLPMISLLRGYFQSYEETHLVGISQVVEQFVRVILIIGITFYVVSTNRSLYELGTLAALATIIGTFVAVIYLGIKFLLRKNSMETPTSKIPFRQTAKWFFAGVFIYSLTYVLHLIFQAVDVMTMIPLLQEHGWSFEESKVQKGIFDRGNPMIQLGLVFGSSLAFALIPSLQSKRKQGEAVQAIQMTFLFSLAASAGLIAIMPFLNPLFYLDQQGTTAIQWLMLLVFLLSLIITFSVLLQSTGYKQQQFKWIVLMFAVKIAWQLLVDSDLWHTRRQYRFNPFSDDFSHYLWLDLAEAGWDTFGFIILRKSNDHNRFHVCHCCFRRTTFFHTCNAFIFDCADNSIKFHRSHDGVNYDVGHEAFS